jgi:N-acetylmuramoyl-L-alanine amidase
MSLIIKDYPSPNFNARKLPLDMIVIHYTELTDTAKTLLHLATPENQVSAHYVIDYDGTIYRMVDEDKRAWHAGVSKWQFTTDINSRSIGIEIMNDGKSPYKDAQMLALVALIKEIQTRYKIYPENIVGHSDVAPGRKIDPGPFFAWDFLAQRGIENVHVRSLSARFNGAVRFAVRASQHLVQKIRFKK